MRTGLRREAADDIGTDDVIENVSALMRLAPGHPLRGQRCLLCSTLIGGRECRLATLTDLRRGGCDCGAIDTITMLICADHGTGADVNWLEVLTDRWELHHGTVAT